MSNQNNRAASRDPMTPPRLRAEYGPAVMIAMHRPACQLGLLVEPQARREIPVWGAVAIAAGVALVAVGITWAVGVVP